MNRQITVGNERDGPAENLRFGGRNNDSIVQHQYARFCRHRDAVMIAGFIVDGPPGSPLKVIIRGLGPALTQFGVPNALQDPTLPCATRAVT